MLYDSMLFSCCELTKHNFNTSSANTVSSRVDELFVSMIVAKIYSMKLLAKRLAVTGQMFCSQLRVLWFKCHGEQRIATATG